MLPPRLLHPRPVFAVADRRLERGAVPRLGASLVALALIAAPLPSVAAPGEEPAQAEPEVTAEPEAEPEVTAEPEAEPEPEVTAEVAEVEPADRPVGGGVAGPVVDPNDPNATRAQSDLEGESLDRNADVAERLPKLQAAGWWTTFGAVALATAGGVLAGVAEAREDEAERLAYGFDLSTGRTNLYDEVGDDYERVLREGNTYQWAARGLVIAGGVALLAGVGLFIADGVQRRRAKRGGAAKLRVEPGAGLRLRF